MVSLASVLCAMNSEASQYMTSVFRFIGLSSVVMAFAFAAYGQDLGSSNKLFGAGNAGTKKAAPAAKKPASKPTSTTKKSAPKPSSTTAKQAAPKKETKTHSSGNASLRKTGPSKASNTTTATV